MYTKSLFGTAPLVASRSQMSYITMNSREARIAKSGYVDRISSAVLRGVFHEGRLVGRDVCNREQEGNRDT